MQPGQAGLPQAVVINRFVWGVFPVFLRVFSGRRLRPASQPWRVHGPEEIRR
ncbi:hypothetical protein C4K40_0874 [Pseudomonas sp. CMR5c]|nr:hypothetical protein C4K40_0874 [Pseudomonas sp. CMR5c]